MFAVLMTGGKQYKVATGDVLKVEKIAGTAGDKVQFNEILMLSGEKIAVGTPLVEDAGVQAEILEQGKGPKVIHYVKRRRKHGSQRKKGHRQQLTVLKVTDILAKGASGSGVAAAVDGAGFVAAAAGPKKARESGSGGRQKASARALAAADDLKNLSGVSPAA